MLSKLSNNISFAVNTDTFWPVNTKDSIRYLKKLGIFDIELTLQNQDFHLTFERNLHMPLKEELVSMVKSGNLRVHSLHAPDMNAKHSHSLRARGEYLSY